VLLLVVAVCVVREKIADMAVSEIGWSWRLLCNSHGVRKPNTPLFLQIPTQIGFTRFSSCVVARALDPKTEDQNSTSSSQVKLKKKKKLFVFGDYHKKLN